MAYAEISDSKTIVTASDISRPTNIRPTDACLVEIYGSNLGKRYIIGREALIIGRDASCTIVIPQDNISRFHVKLSKINNEAVEIEDLDSTNGTFVNDIKIIDPQILANGDLVRIGATVFKYINGTNIEAVYYEEIYRMTIIDGLTGISNKRYLMETLTKEMGRSQRYGRPLSLVFFDIDHFKKINDTYGHIAGDYVLRHLCQTLSRYIRQEEVFARYGGEEFIIMLPEFPLEKALSFGRKLRAKVENTLFDFNNSQLPVTVSVGVAQLSTESTVEEFIATADGFLYQAKNSGRNKVCPEQAE